MNFWLAIHVVTVWTGFALFILASLGAALYIYISQRLKSQKVSALPKNLPSLELIDRFNFGLVILGFLFLTTGILLGGNLVNLIGGRAIHTDTKIVFTWVTWGVFAAYLVLRSLWRWQSIQSNYLILAGFALALLSWGIFR